MSEDAPVNTGAVNWPDPNSAYFTVRRMQTKLHHWATQEPGRRFGDLHNLVYDPAFLMAAWERVSTNKGAKTPGIDKATAAQIETGIGVEAFLSQTRNSLKSGEFRPVEVRQVMIPKANGKLRRLGIPTIADRVVQASLKLVLEPVPKRTSSRPHMVSAPTGERKTRFLRSTSSAPTGTSGCWNVTSKPVSMKFHTRR